MVLRVGTQRWVPASSVKGLFPSAPPAPMPPPVPAPVPAPKANLASRRLLLAEAQVVPDAVRCVQCGCCSYNCPIGIDVRAHAWRGLPVQDSHCLTCGECVKRCPRGVLSFAQLPLFNTEG
jgi:ferredoxin